MIQSLVGERYEIIGQIGSGTFGTVYKARDIQSGHLIAVKIFPCADVEEVPYKRLLRSIEATKVLSHPNVLAPIDSGFINDTTPYVVTDYCEGALLSDVLKRTKFLSVERTVAIAAQVCDAIDHAHYYGVIHRNLKPSNIMIIRSGNVEHAKVLDFGLAKSFYQCTKAGKMKLTVSGEVIGTPEFMSPEQCKQGEIDWRSDIYAMGCLIYSMLTGRAPIKGNSQMDTVIRQETDAPLSFDRACPECSVPQSVQQVIFKALTKDRNQRQQTMLELRDELFTAIGQLPPPAPPRPDKQQTARAGASDATD